MGVIADTGFVVALLNPRDRRHSDVAPVARSLRVLPWLVTPALTEICYLLESRGGRLVVQQFVDRLNDPNPGLALLDPHAEDYARTAQILARYGDSGVDFVDALVVAVAERLDIRTVLTLDRRHFGLIRPAHCPAFDLLPE